MYEYNRVIDLVLLFAFGIYVYMYWKQLEVFHCALSWNFLIKISWLHVTTKIIIFIAWSAAVNKQLISMLSNAPSVRLWFLCWLTLSGSVVIVIGITVRHILILWVRLWSISLCLSWISGCLSRIACEYRSIKLDYCKNLKESV